MNFIEEFIITAERHLATVMDQASEYADQAQDCIPAMRSHIRGQCAKAIRKSSKLRSQIEAAKAILLRRRQLATDQIIAEFL